MENTRLIKLFVSCPSDIINELDSIRLIVEEINKTSGKQNKFILEVIHWTKDTYTGIGTDAQEVINKQISYDILVSIFWQKIGTPTLRGESGTAEEIDIAIDNPNVRLLVYFNIAPPEDLNSIDLEQLIKLREYKQKLSGRGLLYKEFQNIKEFESLFRINIINLIVNEVLPSKKSFHGEPEKLGKYHSIETIIQKVESRDESIIDDDIFEMTEKFLSNSEGMHSSLNSLTILLNEFTSKLNKRTDEIARINHIKDNKLRVSKGQIITNLLADELLDFNTSLNGESDRFSNFFIQLGETYSKIVLLAGDIETDEISNMKRAAREFRDTIETTIESNVVLLAEILKWPPVNSKFNKAKRQTEIAFKDLAKAMLEGLKILDSVVG